ncbi:hypothetical protein D9V30_08415 [Mycetocola reblochoni]|uniref:Uncharacterized protein n=2 Tax=Mycetocola reblochoni TaxID=331618 RepID=A0A1R4JR02_9MICO|nr:hypothetical protein [Mycetocola reblochoni]RLP69320.1 hypothetical protein D9V30_08415 [Mycetocola reblochoni]SJN34213.1 hypothetical protein FM119_08835 [Mycetocola reblochoni REB411]
MFIEIDRDGETLRVPAVIVRCTSATCSNAGLDLIIPADYGDSIICGVCRTAITEITAPPEPAAPLAIEPPRQEPTA